MDADLTRRQILRGTAAGVGLAATSALVAPSAASA
ncbi:twin-arginine translocation signal domain-containing protein, partial [Amycolatopsis sp. SID8362]|nr:twin-arginine translocation signal domain-containing protein [Amycolatopsis sp. SID8362]NED41676.1 twin-arginine translocation signal domain-containing protein [Amycolatopsis sp. SID8362]